MVVGSTLKRRAISATGIFGLASKVRTAARSLPLSERGQPGTRPCAGGIKASQNTLTDDSSLELRQSPEKVKGFDWGKDPNRHLEPAAKALRHKWPEREIVLCADARAADPARFEAIRSGLKDQTACRVT